MKCILEKLIKSIMNCEKKADEVYFGEIDKVNYEL